MPPPLSVSDPHGNWQAQRRALRRELRQRRRALTPAAQQEAALALARRLLRLPEVRRAHRIAIYLPQDGEISPLPFARQARRHGKHILVPVLRHFPQDHLHFAPWPAGRRRRNRFGITEPAGNRTVAAATLDLMLLPLVGFDSRGGRLGMGGGFYDRTLAFKQRQHARKPVLMGLAHDCQQVPALDLANWDVPLRAIVTGKHCYRVR